jgi:acetyl-CoA carboxylase carboxyl transferase subunit alpha
MPAQPLEFEKPILELEQKLDALKNDNNAKVMDIGKEVERMEEKLEKMRCEVYKNLTPWQRVQIARHIHRPFMLDYVKSCFTDFLELKGDRLYSDDASMPAGLAQLDGRRVAVIGQQKGRDLKENMKRNFGSPHPEGYRKALRVMKMAEKFELPVICLIDTPGAYPGIGAESRHIAEAIAVNLREMMVLRVPTIAVVIGEGGSGGALGIGVADTVGIFENSYYSVISPEGCAAILWKDRKFAPEAADALKLGAREMKDLGLVDEVLPEPLGGAHKNAEKASSTLKEFLTRELERLSGQGIEELLKVRYQKFRRFGRFEEQAKQAKEESAAAE